MGCLAPCATQLRMIVICSGERVALRGHPCQLIRVGNSRDNQTGRGMMWHQGRSGISTLDCQLNGVQAQRCFLFQSTVTGKTSLSQDWFDVCKVVDLVPGIDIGQRQADCQRKTADHVTSRYHHIILGRESMMFSSDLSNDVLNSDIVTWAEVPGENGCQTAGMGKRHFGRDLTAPGRSGSICEHSYAPVLSI